MSTTAIFVEILIIGIQSVIWMSLFVLGVVGYDWIRTTYIDLDGWTNLVVVVLLALFYTLGIIIDRLADLFFMLIQPKKLLLKGKLLQRMFQQAQSDARMEVLLQERRAIEFLGYARSRIRIVRATLLNLFFGIVAALFFILKRIDVLGGIPKQGLVLVVLIVGILAGSLVFIVLGMLQITYDNRLTQAKAALSRGQQKRQKESG